VFHQFENVESASASKKEAATMVIKSKSSSSSKIKHSESLIKIVTLKKMKLSSGKRKKIHLQNLTSVFTATFLA
jgi:hypothetical protein